MYKERIANLMNAVKDGEFAEDDLEFIESRMKAFASYISHVTWMETRIQRLTIEGIDGEEWRSEVSRLDDMRRSKHDVAMNSINQLNRLCAANGLEPFYDGPVDHEHRTEVGDAIGEIVNEYFKDRQNGQTKSEDQMDDFAKAVESMSFEATGLAR